MWKKRASTHRLRGTVHVQWVQMHCQIIITQEQIGTGPSNLKVLTM